MKVRCIKRYSDVKLKKIIEVDTIFDVDEERAKHLVNEKVAEIVNETEKTTEKAAGEHTGSDRSAGGNYRLDGCQCRTGDL